MEGNSIPALFATPTHPVATGSTIFKNGKFETAAEESISSIKELRGGKVRGKALIIDSESLNRRQFNPPMIEDAKISGCDLWLATVIENMDDLTDAFLGNMTKLVFPVHCLDKYTSPKDIYDASDSCIPLVVCEKGLPLSGKDVISEVRNAHSAGFANVVVLDCDGMISDSIWSILSSECPGLGVFSPARESLQTREAPVSFHSFRPYSVLQ